VSPVTAPKTTVNLELVQIRSLYSLFFIVKDLDKVTLVIREQFIFRRFIMLNMFLGAAGFSAFV